MLYIRKGRLPKALLEETIEIKKSPEWQSADENNDILIRSFFDRLDKKLIRSNLVAEQHGLCAYCMKRISPDDNMRIEHYIPIKGHKTDALDFNNMLGCCDGGSKKAEEEHRVLCCDAAKGSQKLTLDPRNANMVERIRYQKDGRIYIYPFDVVLQNDIDSVLCLNGKLDEEGQLKYDTSTQIVKGRRDAYNNYALLMKGIYKKCNGKEPEIRHMIERKIKEIESADVYPEYAGVLLYFLKRRMRGNTPVPQT